MCLKKAMAAHSISFFWSASLCIWKIRLASTLTLKHRYTHTQTETHTHTQETPCQAVLLSSVQLVNGRNGFLTDLWLSSPSLPHFWIIAIEIDERNFVFLSPFSFCFICFFFFRYALPPAHWGLWFGFGLVSFSDSVRAAPSDWAGKGSQAVASFFSLCAPAKLLLTLAKPREGFAVTSLPVFLTIPLVLLTSEHTLSRKMLHCFLWLLRGAFRLLKAIKMLSLLDEFSRILINQIWINIYQSMYIIFYTFLFLFVNP